MSQLELDTGPDDSIGWGLRPGEDPWSSLAVSQDDVPGDNGIRSPVVRTLDAPVVDDGDGPVPPDDVAAAPGPTPSPAARRAERVQDDRHVGDDDDDGDDELRAERPAAMAAESDECDVEDTVVTVVDAAVEPTRGGGVTIPLVCAGVAILACCLLIPQADANRRLAYQHVKLRADLVAVERQVAVNDEFLRKVADDPNLAERLAQRQMKIIRPGTKVLVLKDSGEAEMSPFQITAVAPPPKLPPYQPRGGTLAQLCYNPKSRLYLMGIGLLLTAVGLVLGFGARSAD